jgi:hypothetical protein
MGDMIDDLIGKKFGKLEVVDRVPKPKGKSGNHVWCLCVCDCGEIVEIRGTCIRTGNTTSCGCAKTKLCKTNLKHGHAGNKGGRVSPEYQAWAKMIRRCESPNDSRYYCYGARGVSVCRAWRHSFEQFLADMGKRPSNEHSLDRKSNDGDYKPSNCRWATKKQQRLNKQNSCLITCEGITKTITEWSEQTGIQRQTIKQRIDKLGWSAEKALTVVPK